MATKKNFTSASASVSTTDSKITLEKSKVAEPAYTLTAAEALPFRFDRYEEALDARNELKQKLAASKELLMKAEAVFVGVLDDNSFLLYAISVTKRFDNEHQWFELVDQNGESFGFIDSEDEEAESTFALTVQRGDGAFHMPYIELANPSGKVTCSVYGAVADILKRWRANADAQESFDNLVANPVLRDEELLKRFDAYLGEFAKKRLKNMK